MRRPFEKHFADLGRVITIDLNFMHGEVISKLIVEETTKGITRIQSTFTRPCVQPNTYQALM